MWCAFLEFARTAGGQPHLTLELLQAAAASEGPAAPPPGVGSGDAGSPPPPGAFAGGGVVIKVRAPDTPAIAAPDHRPITALSRRLLIA